MPIQSDIIEPFPSGIAIIEFVIIDFLLLISFFIIIIKRKNIFVGTYDVLEMENGNKIRGLLSVLIVIHHLSLNIRYAFILKAFSIIGIVCVAIFFFYSGYGLMLNYSKCDNYLKSFFSKRLMKIILPYLVSMLMTWLGYLLIKYKFTPREMLNSIFDGNPFVRYSWYVLTIIVLYIVFFLSGKIFKSPKKMLGGIFIGTLLYSVVVISKFSWGNWTINSCFSFLFGAAASIYQERAQKILCPNKKYAMLLFAVFFLCGSMIVFKFLNGGFILNQIIKFPEIADYLLTKPLLIIGMNVLCFVLIILSFWWLRKIKLNDKVFLFLGKISFNIYLYHGLIMYLLRNSRFYCKVDILYMILTFALTLLIATIMTKVNEIVYVKILL